MVDPTGEDGGSQGALRRLVGGPGSTSFVHYPTLRVVRLHEARRDGS